MIDDITQKRALRLGVALALGVIIYRYFSITQGFWVLLTTAIVIQPTLSSTLRKGVQRFLGTIAGILLGTALVIWLHQPWQLDVFLVLTLFIAYYLKAFNLVSYGIFVVPLTTMVVMLVSAFVPDEASRLIVARCVDTSIGALLAIIISFIFLPISHRKLITRGVVQIDEAEKNYKELLTAFPKNIDQIYNSQQQFEKCLSLNREYYHDSFYEHLFSAKKRHLYKQFILQSERLGQLLLGLNDLIAAEQPIANDLMSIYQQKIDEQLNVFHDAKKNILYISRTKR